MVECVDKVVWPSLWWHTLCNACTRGRRRRGGVGRGGWQSSEKLVESESGLHIYCSQDAFEAALFQGETV